MDPKKTEALMIPETTMATLSIYDRMGDPMSAIMALGKAFAASGMLGVKTADQGAIIALTCMVEKITPLEFIRTYDIVDGKPTKKAAAMDAEFRSHGGNVKWIKYTETECSAIFTHPVFAPDGFPLSITLEELKNKGVALTREGKLKDNYRRSPRQMLAARLRAEAIRLIDPAVNAGLYCEEELDSEPTPYIQILPEKAGQVIDCEIPPNETAKPEEQPATPPEPQLSDRAKKVISCFAGWYGLIRDDLERFAAGGEGSIRAEHWAEPEYAKFNAVKEQLVKVPQEYRAQEVQVLFGLEPGATVE